MLNGISSHAPRPIMIIATLATLAALAGCSSGASSSAPADGAASGPGAAAAQAPNAASLPSASAAASAASTAGSSGGFAAAGTASRTGGAAQDTSARYIPDDQQLVYTAQLAVRAKNVGAALSTATSIVTAAGGYVSAENSTGAGPASPPRARPRP